MKEYMHEWVCLIPGKHERPEDSVGGWWHLAKSGHMASILLSSQCRVQRRHVTTQNICGRSLGEGGQVRSQRR